MKRLTSSRRSCGWGVGALGGCVWSLGGGVGMPGGGVGYAFWCREGWWCSRDWWCRKEWKAERVDRMKFLRYNETK